MSSGRGIFTKKGRCNQFWAEFSKCQQVEELPLLDCRQKAEDYLECLHHTKEVRLFVPCA